MDVFEVAVGAGGDFLRAAAIDAGYELGIFAALAKLEQPVSLDQLATAIGIDRGRHRLRALIDVLVALRAIERRGDRLVAGSPPRRPVVTRSGWGLMAGVIRGDQPLELERGGELELRMHRHLADAGAQAARELAPLLAGPSLLDIGCGAGTYTAAFLDANPGAFATVVDSHEVLALARDYLARFGDRVRFVEGDARFVDVGQGFGAVLLANVVHLHSMEVSSDLFLVASQAVAPGCPIVIKDLRVEDDRSGPIGSLLFALGMKIYTTGGDVYTAADLRRELARAGFAYVKQRALSSSPDSVVMIGWPARGAATTFDETVGGPPLRRDVIAMDLDAQLARVGVELGDDDLEIPAPLRDVLAAAVAEGEDRVRVHYIDTMPRMRREQLGSEIFQLPLDWDRLPRLRRALDRLFSVVADNAMSPTRLFGFATTDALHGRSLGELYRETHYGRLMPMLYGYPADLAYFASREPDIHARIDRYLTAPVIHELCHFARDRDALRPPHLDECIGGWLGVHVHPELAFPAPGYDDAIYAAPWLSQVGQAVARAFGTDVVVRAHAGAVLWDAVIPRRFLETATRLAWGDWLRRRTLHFLSDTFDPVPWVALALMAGAKRSLKGATLESLAATPLIALADELPVDDAFDRAIVEDGLRAMCLDNACIAGSLRARTKIPDAAITIDARACTITAPRRGDVDTVAPRYWLPPHVAARLIANQIERFDVVLRDIDDIPRIADAICAGAPR